LSKDLTKIANWQFVNVATTGECDPVSFEGSEIIKGMKLACEILYLDGFMPPVKNHPGSTHGNMAVRAARGSNNFIVTTTGSHKGFLKDNDFTLVSNVDWNDGLVEYNAPLDGGQPSSEVWMMNAILEKLPNINVVIHAHCFPPNVSARVTISYPPLQKREYPELLKALHQSPVAIMEKHGCVSVGKYIIQSLARISELEKWQTIDL
jgi:ribulose-5-phosphate 4-epimerase/fuculose-1-phosphate aldolase